MGLSEREKRVLAEMERELFGASTIDPKLRPANSVRKLVAGILISIIGLSVLLFAAISGLVWIGVVGFCIALFGVLAASANPASRGKSGPRGSSNPKTGPKASGGSFFADRWDRRQGE